MVCRHGGRVMAGREMRQLTAFRLRGTSLGRGLLGWALTSVGPAPRAGLSGRRARPKIRQCYVPGGLPKRALLCRAFSSQTRKQSSSPLPSRLASMGQLRRLSPITAPGRRNRRQSYSHSGRSIPNDCPGGGGTPFDSPPGGLKRISAFPQLTASATAPRSQTPFGNRARGKQREMDEA
jgi:hypothetical protein